MSIFTTFRTAIKLGAEVEQLRHQVQELERRQVDVEMGWTDTLDKLLAREERWRKRYKAEVDRGLAEQGGGGNPGGAVAHPTDRKALLRQRVASLKAT